MPKIKRKIGKNLNFTRFFTFIFVILCLGVCAFVAELFSNVLVVGSFSENNSAKDLSYTVYAVSVESHSSKMLAEEKAKEIKLKNGAGFVYEKDGKFHILVSCYEKENDAKLVAENLSSYSPIIIEIKVPNIPLEIENASKDYFRNALKLFKSSFLKLYDISVSLDTNVETIPKAKILISEIKTEIEETQNELKDHIPAGTSALYLKIKIKTNNVIDLLSELITYDNENIPFSSKIKYTYLQIIDLNISLSEDIEKM